MSKFRWVVLMSLTTLWSCTPAELQQALNTVLTTTDSVTSAEAAAGLKQALELGIGKGADLLSRENGYFKSAYKILLPAEARKVTDKLQGIPGFSEIENIILEKINRGAEDAAAKAKPIFVDAIRNMTFADAMNILMGDKDAATRYLEAQTYNALFEAFSPVIVESLDKFNAREYWSKAVNTYNALPLNREKVNPSLDEYVTQEALKGLFSMVEKEEFKIRTDISARTTDLLKKVFAKQDR